MNDSEQYDGFRIGSIAILGEFMARESLWDTVTFGIELGVNADLAYSDKQGYLSEQKAEAKLIIQLYGVRLFVSGAATGLYRGETGEWKFAPILTTGVAYHF